MNELPSQAGVPPPLPARTLVWSPGLTLLWSVAIAAAYVGVMLVTAIGFVVVAAATSGMSNINVIALQSEGLLLSLGTCLATPVVLLACYFIIKLKRGLPAFDYIGIAWVPFLRWWLWIVGMIGYIIASDFLTHWLGRPIVPEFMVETYRTAVFPVLLWFTVIVAAPLSEEVFFRGFMFRGLQASRLGGIGAILITSFLWAVVHLQYDGYQMVQIFGGGLLLGGLRLRTGSVVPGMLMHGLQNAWATVELLLGF